MQYFPQRYLAANTRDDCTENGRVKYCKPELVNIIQSKGSKAVQKVDFFRSSF